jgi:hypothetical protein
MMFDDFDDDRDADGAGLEDPDNSPDSQGFDLERPSISRGSRRSIDSADQDDHDPQDPDYSYEEPDDDFENFINRTYVCEDCDFRWAEKIYPERNDYPDYDDEMGHAHICPMCGSMNVSFY